MTSTDTNNKDRQQRSNASAKIDYIQKLSNDKALAEAILIRNKPTLAVVDFRNIDDVKIVTMDSLAYDVDLRYKPILLSNRPYSFKDKDELLSYVQKASGQTLDSLFDRTLSIWKKYIDAYGFHLKLCAADTIFTYFQDRLGMTHYLFFVADNDAGKSNNLTLLNILAYRNLMSNSMTHANVYNFLGDKDEGVGTICYDEADNLDEYHDIMSIFKEGYTTGRPVVRTLDTVHGKRQVKLNTFGFKAFAGERLPDAVTSRGFLQRTVELRCLPGYPEYDISEVINPVGDNEYQGLLDELNDLRNTLFCYRLIHFKDKLPNIKLNIRNREKQLFKPLLRLFQGTRTFDTLLPVTSHFVNERRQKKVDSFHAFLYRSIMQLIKSQNTLELRSGNVWDYIKMNLEWKEIPSKPQSIDTVEFGTISLKSVIQTLTDVFHAKPHRSSSRSLVFSQHVLDRMRQTYDIALEIRVNLEGSTHSTHSTLSVGIDTISNQSDNKENDTDTKENDENLKETDANVIESTTENNAEISEHPGKATKASQASKASTQSNEEECNLVDQEGADRFKAEVERLGRSKSKLADAAEANLSGNGLLDGKQTNV